MRVNQDVLKTVSNKDYTRILALSDFLQAREVYQGCR
jgi:hypothetical protein